MKGGRELVIDNVTLVYSGSIVYGNVTSNFSIPSPTNTKFAGSIKGENVGGKFSNGD